MDYAHAEGLLERDPSPLVKRWVDAQLKPYSKLMYGFSGSAAGRIFTLVRFYQPGKEYVDARIALSEEIDKLNKLGCAETFLMHTYKARSESQERSNKNADLCIFMPCNKSNEIHKSTNSIEAPETPLVVPDFEGAVTFLAYLLYKGYVTPDDIPPGDPVYDGQEWSNPFGQTMLKFAQSDEYQNKVRQGLANAAEPAAIEAAL